MNNRVINNITFLSHRGDINLNINEAERFIEFVIRITKNCNENCLFCNTMLSKSSIAIEDFIEIVNYIQEKYLAYTIVFCLSGGEPTLHNDFSKMVQYLYEKGLKIKIQTNATLFSSRQFLSKIQPFSENIEFFISFHSHIPCIYNTITQSKLYESSLKGIINIYKNFNSEKIQLNLVLNKLNFNSYDKYLPFVKEVFGKYGRVIHIIFSVIYPNKEHHKKLLVNYNDTVILLNKVLHLSDNKLDLHYEFGSYCQLPICFLNKLELSSANITNAGLDKNVGMGNMGYSSRCGECKHYDSCIGLPKMYLEVFGENHIIPVL